MYPFSWWIVFGINKVTEGDIVASRCNCTTELGSLAFWNVQDRRSHQEETQYNYLCIRQAQILLELLTSTC